MVLAVQPPALEVIDAMRQGAILISFIYADKEPALAQRFLDKKITCFAMERIPRISRAKSMDALSSQSAFAGYYAVALGMTHMTSVLPKITSAAGVIGPAKVLVRASASPASKPSPPHSVWVPLWKAMTSVLSHEGAGPYPWERLSSTLASTPPGKGGYARALTVRGKGQGRRCSDPPYPGPRT